jgi:hypothetical protein
VQSLLKSLAQTFAVEFIAQADTRTEKIGGILGLDGSHLLLHFICDHSARGGRGAADPDD